MLFAGYHDYSVRVWDVSSDGTTESAGDNMKTSGFDGRRNSKPVFQLNGHTNRISSLGVNNDGDCIATGSWDTLLKVSHRINFRNIINDGWLSHFKIF